MMLMLLAVLGAGGDLPAQVKAQLGEVNLVRGAFEQQKQVKGFKRPLVEVCGGMGVSLDFLRQWRGAA